MRILHTYIYIYIYIYQITNPAVIKISRDVIINLLAPKLLKFLAHPVRKIWIIQEPKNIALWNKEHLEEKEMESVQHVLKIQYVYLLKKY
jgi:hypothetical protein